MKIAVLGGSGFIGSVLVRKLIKQKHDVTIFDIEDSFAYPDLRVDLDVRDKDAMVKSLKGFDVIYNLAAAHRDDVRPISLYYDTNVGGAQNTIVAARQNNIKNIIFTSSVALYGLNVGIPDETFPSKPFNDYGQSKSDAEDVFKTWQDEDNTNSLTMIRPVAIFGPGNRGNIFNLINQIASGKFFMIGNGQNEKSIGYVDNLADFLVHSLTFKPGLNIYNFADKPDLTMNGFVKTVREALGRSGVGLRFPYIIGIAGGYTFDMLSKLTGKTFPISSVRVKKFCANTQVAADKLKETGFIPRHRLEDALTKTIEIEFPCSFNQQNNKQKDAA